jgi:hypothetical protein
MHGKNSILTNNVYMIKIYIQNYFMENMFHKKKKKTDNNK